MLESTIFHPPHIFPTHLKQPLLKVHAHEKLIYYHNDMIIKGETYLCYKEIGKIANK